MYPNPEYPLQFQIANTNTLNSDDKSTYNDASSSPPAVFHQHLVSDFGISHTKEDESHNHPQALVSSHKHKQSRLSSDQLSFKNHDSRTARRRLLSANSRLKKASSIPTPSGSGGFTISPWEECDSFEFDDACQVHDLSEFEEGFNAAGEDLVAWRVRAKRGFATNPRSIAERERRIRINCKLKTLHDLLPNVDKQTSYAEMLDLAVEHVKGLQTQIQGLNEELDSCTCPCNHDE